jgi:hypothetical protein
VYRSAVRLASGGLLEKARQLYLKIGPTVNPRLRFLETNDLPILAAISGDLDAAQSALEELRAGDPGCEPDRVDHMRDMPGFREEMLLDEHVVVGEEDAKVGMGVRPADDDQVGMVPIHFLVDLGPGLMSERDLGELALGRVARNRRRDGDDGPSASLPQRPTRTPQTSTEVIGQGVRPEPGMDFEREEDPEIEVTPTRKWGLGQDSLATGSILNTSLTFVRSSVRILSKSTREGMGRS